jgi:quercetin dioxygenase-like cupin family protein
LPGVIDGVETTYYVQGTGTRHPVPPKPGRGQVLLFMTGAAEVQVDGRAFEFSEIAAICAPGNPPLVIQATAAPLEYLEILVDVRDDEAASLPKAEPFFVRYSQCEGYTEAIKSPRTVSRTIVPPKTIPRFCMGSVEALGPDEVASHSHPMLEQLFFGLPGNACEVTADGAVAPLGDRALLHIPLGSWHGVRVNAGSRMHYIWMDFFRNEKDLAYIQDQHKPIKK